MEIVSAVFIVLQLVAWIVFIRLFVKQSRKKNTEDKNKGREEKLFRLYNSLEEMMDSFEEYVNTARQEIESQRRELSELSRQATVMFLQARDRVSVDLTDAQQADNAADTPASGPASSKLSAVTAIAAPGKPNKPDAIPVNNDSQPGSDKKSPPQNEKGDLKLSNKDREAVRKFSTKPQKVRYLISCGLSVDEVAKELDIGIGEVKLISDLDR